MSAKTLLPIVSEPDERLRPPPWARLLGPACSEADGYGEERTAGEEKVRRREALEDVGGPGRSRLAQCSPEEGKSRGQVKSRVSAYIVK